MPKATDGHMLLHKFLFFNLLVIFFFSVHSRIKIISRHSYTLITILPIDLLPATTRNMIHPLDMGKVELPISNLRKKTLGYPKNGYMDPVSFK